MNDLPARAFIGVGSSLQPEENVTKALASLEDAPGVTLAGISTFYRTAPLSDPTRTAPAPGHGPGDPDPDFLNGVLEIRTVLGPIQLLDLLRGIESALGRERPANRYAPRTMDLDLLLYGKGEEGESALLWEEIGAQGVMAHRDIEGRAFVALPLMELAPDLILPPHRIPLRALAATFDSPGGHPETGYTETLRSRFLHP